MQNALKINDQTNARIVCKHLCNESSNLYEILHGGQILSWELKFQISWRFVHKCAHKSCKRVRERFIMSVRVYDLCVGICAWSFMKFGTLIYLFYQKLVIAYIFIYETCRAKLSIQPGRRDYDATLPNEPCNNCLTLTHTMKLLLDHQQTGYVSMIPKKRWQSQISSNYSFSWLSPSYSTGLKSVDNLK